MIRDEVVVYRTIERFAGYRFGSDGSVWSLWRRDGRRPSFIGDAWWKMVLFTNEKGYPLVNLRVHGAPASGSRPTSFRVHQLIAEAFLGPCPEGLHVLHGPDSTRTNCRADNLRYGTPTENMRDKIRDGTQTFGSRHASAKLDEPKVARIKARLIRGEGPAAMAKEFGVTKEAIRNIRRGINWTHVEPALEVA